MSLLLLGLLLGLASAESSVEDSCAGRGPCWRYPEHLAPPDSSGYGSEDRAISRLLCYLQCNDTAEDLKEMCLSNCSTSPPNPGDISPSLLGPVSEPYLMERNQDGLYIITIPSTNGNEMTSSGSYSVLIASGEAGSDDGLMTGSEGGHDEVYLVRVSQNGDHTYFPLISPQGEINLSQFSCTEVNISYAVVVVSEGRLSDYSPPLTTCIFIPQVDATAAEGLTVTFEETVGLPRYIQQARVFVSWVPPSDVRRLEGYELTVSLTSTDDKDCTQQAPLLFSVNQTETNFTIEPTGDKTTSVLLLCAYNFELVSLPGDQTVSQNVPIEYTRSDRRPSLRPKCDGSYDPSTVTYNLTISWTLNDPLVLEAINRFYFSLHPVNPTLVFIHLSRNIIHTFDRGQTDYVYHFNIPVVTQKLDVSITVRPLKPLRNETFFWRKTIIPGDAQCDFTTVAHRPEQISRDNITVQMKSISSSILSFTLIWTPPTFLNGELERYEICIGEGEITGIGSCSDPSFCIYLPGSDSDSSMNLVGCTSPGVVSSPDQPTTDIDYHVVVGTDLLFLQIRVVNKFDLHGEWSEPHLIFNSSSYDISSRNRGSESSNEVWIYVVAAMLCVVGAALLAVLVLCVYRHYCFHRRIKYEDTMMMERIHGNYYPPTFIPVADEWEVPSEDVEIVYSEELGHGAFGRVYCGLLHCRELRDMVNGERRRGSRKRGSFGQRKLSRRNTSQSVGSRLVAIKRLRDNIEGPDKANFLKEIEMMKKVSGANHDHRKFVVNMLACVTIQEPMMLVLEYATHGDLLTYLRNSREGEEGANNPKAAPYLEPQGAYSKLPPRGPGQEGEEEEDHKLTEKDLLSFARQIAAGMEFLSSLSVVHRDLACRNILVCDNSLVKISDFGLSRTLVNQEAYVTTTKGVLPIRWMAPEALFYRTFDTQSDVWSFGILLWELYTLGGYPYPTMSNRDIIDLLSRGYRMDKPELCSDEVYTVMLRCWTSLGVERPTFQELYLTFDQMLGESTRHQTPYIQVLGTCYYDKLGPRVQVDSETLDLENVPANVDVRQPGNATTTATTTTTAEGVFGTSLPENGNGFLSVAGQGGGLQSQDHGASPVVDGRGQRLGVPLHLSRPRSWVGTSTAELGPRYVPAPLYYASPHSSTSNLTQETTFGSSVVTMSPEHRQLQSRSVGSLPLLTNPSALHSNTRTTRL